jgi:BNR/Asp-box repeat
VDQGLWRSADAGDTWSQRYPPSGASGLDTFDQLLVDPHRPETLYSVESDFSSGEIVAVSRDGGVTFKAGQPYSLYSQSPDPIRIQPVRGELLAFVYEGLESSRDGGQTWQLRSRFAQGGFNGGDIAPSAPDTLYALPFDNLKYCLARSDDDGAHWLRLTYPPHLPAAHATCYDVRVDPRDARHVWVAAEIVAGTERRDLLFASRDGGETWSRGLPLPAPRVLAAGGEELYASGNAAGLSVSEDGAPGRRRTAASSRATCAPAWSRKGCRVAAAAGGWWRATLRSWVRRAPGSTGATAERTGRGPRSLPSLSPTRGARRCWPRTTAA